MQVESVSLQASAGNPTAAVADPSPAAQEDLARDPVSADGPSAAGPDANCPRGCGGGSRYDVARTGRALTVILNATRLSYTARS